jgi:Flp pilus assembly protein TadG
MLPGDGAHARRLEIAMRDVVRPCASFLFATEVLGVFGPKNRFFPLSLSCQRVAPGLRDFCADQSGTIAVITGLSATALVGFAALAIDVASWQAAQHSMQGAADAAAYSAGIAYNNNDGTSITIQAKAISAAQGYVDGQNNATVTVNQPPKSGSYTGTSTAIEVIIQQPQPRFLAGLFLASNPTVNARAVAKVSNPSCILALDTTASSAIGVSGSTSITSNCDLTANSTSSSAISMSGSSTIKTPCLVSSGGVSVTSGLTLTQCTSATTHAAATADPYASVPTPTASGSCLTPATSGNTQTFSPGKYCSGISLSGSNAATFQPGVYYIEGNFTISGSATATGTGVTFYITSPNSVTFTGNQGATFTAPTSGTYAGIAFFGDRSGSANNNNKFTGGSVLNITGALYFPSESVTYTGGSSTGANCTQIVADTISVTGNSYFSNHCIGDGLADALSVQLVE